MVYDIHLFNKTFFLIFLPISFILKCSLSIDPDTWDRSILKVTIIKEAVNTLGLFYIHIENKMHFL